MEIANLLNRLTHVQGGPDQYTARCPSHNDHHNSLSVGLGTDGRILLRCHAGCTLQQVLDSLDLQVRDLYPDVPVIRTERTRGEVYLQKCKKGENSTQFCPASQVVYPYHDADGKLLYEVVRKPLPDGGKGFVQRRISNGSYQYNLRGVEPVLYRLPQVLQGIQRKEIIFLCEGEKDVDALVNLGFVATSSPMGAGKWKQGYTDSLSGASKVVLIPDHDKAGRAHGMMVCKSLAAAGIPVQVIDLKSLFPELADKGDVSDVLTSSEQVSEWLEKALSFTEFAELAARRDATAEQQDVYLVENAASYLENGFWQELNRTREGTRRTTGFPSLDSQVDGHLYPGLYVVGSVSSLGKTAFCLQVADHLASCGTDVLFYTLEMSRLEMVARSLVRQVFLDSGCCSDLSVGKLLSGVGSDDQIGKAMEQYKEGVGGHIAFVEGGAGVGAAQISQDVESMRWQKGHAPVVFVDYLQILAPPDLRMSDKQAIDANILALKRISREHEIPVVAVSSFNRQNYTEEVNMASFKESGSIEYSADFILGLQAWGISEKSEGMQDSYKTARMVKDRTRQAKQQDPRPIEAVTLKNRRGPAWASFSLDFYPRQNYFLETGR